MLLWTSSPGSGWAPRLAPALHLDTMLARCYAAANPNLLSLV